MPPDPVRVADTRAWLEKAEQDLRSAQADLAFAPPVVGDAVFHCQQAVEKALKLSGRRLCSHAGGVRGSPDTGVAGCTNYQRPRAAGGADLSAGGPVTAMKSQRLSLSFQRAAPSQYAGSPLSEVVRHG